MSFLSRQNKSFVATKQVFRRDKTSLSSRQNKSFVATKQVFRRDKTSLSSRQNKSFVATKVCLLRQTFCRDKHTFVATNTCFVVTSTCLSRQKDDTCGSSRQDTSETTLELKDTSGVGEKRKTTQRFTTPPL